MWQDIINKAKSTLAGRIQNGVGLNPIQAENSVQLAGETTREVLIQEARDGNVDGLISLFKGEDETSTSHPLSLKISDRLHGKLVDQLGIRPEDAKEVEHATVPYILKQVGEQLSSDRATADTGGIAPDTGNIEAIFGADTLSEGMKDKFRKQLGDRI